MEDILAQFNPRPHQTVVLDHIRNNRFSIIMNSDETDMASSYALFILDYILSNKDKTVVLCTNKIADYVEIMDLLLEYFTALDQQEITIWNVNRQRKKFSNGCMVQAYTTNKNTYIQYSVDCFILKDMALIRPSEVKDLYTMIVPSVTAKKDSKIIISSAPNGTNLFYDIFKKAEKLPAENMFAPLRLYYWQVSGRDGKWVTEKINQFGEEYFNEKFNLVVRESKHGLCLPTADELLSNDITGYTVTFKYKT